jgi:hypothetical protein
MADTKLEPRLEHELARLEAAGEAGKLVPVVIEHARPVRADPGGDPCGDPGERLERFSRESGARLSGIMARLTDLGAGRFEPVPLATAISAELTAGQIRAVARHPDVRLIHLATPEMVIPGS